MQHIQLSRLKKRTVGVVVTASLAALLMVPSLAFADTSAEKQAEAEAALASLNTMAAKLDAASNDLVVAQEEQSKAEANRDEAQGRINTANDKIVSLQDRLGTRARSMYRSGESSVLDLLFGATSFQTFATNWDLLNSLNQNDADLVQQTKDLRTEVQEQEKVYAEQQRIATEKANEAQRTKEEAESTVSSMQAVYNSLSAEAAQLLEQERAAQVAAQAAVAQQVVANAAAEASNSNNTNQANDQGSSNGGSSSGGSSFTPSYNAATGNAVVDRAMGCIGAGYNYASCGPSEFDCSGLVSYAITGSYSRLGSTYTFLGYQQVSDPQPGDIAVNEGHCGIYIGGGMMVHAATYGVGVVTGPVQEGMVFRRP